jgi:hypothetical protein
MIDDYYNDGYLAAQQDKPCLRPEGDIEGRYLTGYNAAVCDMLVALHEDEAERERAHRAKQPAPASGWLRLTTDDGEPVLVNASDDLSLLRIINTPRRGLGDVAIGRLQGFAAENAVPLRDTLLDAGQVPGFTAAAVSACTRLGECFARWSEQCGGVGDATAVERGRVPVSDTVRLVFEESGSWPLSRPSGLWRRKAGWRTSRSSWAWRGSSIA